RDGEQRARGGRAARTLGAWRAAAGGGAHRLNLGVRGSRREAGGAAETEQPLTLPAGRSLSHKVLSWRPAGAAPVLRACWNRSARPGPGHLHDPLFADIAPGSANASARLLSVLYEQYTEADAPAPQYAHYRRMVRAIVGGDDPRMLRGLTGKALQRIRAAYV